MPQQTKTAKHMGQTVDIGENLQRPKPTNNNGAAMPKAKADPMQIIDERMNDLKRAIKTTMARHSWPADDKADKRSLQQIISDEREARGLSLQGLADMTRMSKGHMWELENGRTKNPTVNAIYEISCALGVPFMVLCKAAVRDKDKG